MYRIAFFPPNKQYGPSRQISDALLKQALSVTDNKSTIKGYDSVLPEHILYIGINTKLYISSACHLLEHSQPHKAKLLFEGGPAQRFQLEPYDDVGDAELALETLLVSDTKAKTLKSFFRCISLCISPSVFLSVVGNTAKMAVFWIP